MNVGGNIRRIREAKGVTQTELAEAAGVTQSMLCQIERGTKNPSLQVANEFALALGCAIEDFLNDVA